MNWKPIKPITNEWKAKEYVRLKKEKNKNLTHSYKKVDHKKYIKGQVDLLCHVTRPLLALLHTLTVLKHSLKNK